MNVFGKWMLLGTSGLACMIAASASAQSSPQATDARTGSEAESVQADTTGVNTDPSQNGDIIVTARRKAENLQNVPQTVTAVSGESIAKLAITQFQDVASVVPGLSLGNSSSLNGGGPAPSLRGISFDAGASNSPTVDIYINEVPTNAQVAYSALYDIGAVEVLRGPQGTLRGRTAPSGALTITTRRADLSEWGGYVSALGTEKGSINAQAALNIPIITDVLALRVSGLIDQNNGNFVTSVNHPVEPYVNSASGRATLSFKPSSNFDATVTYQKLNQHSQQFIAVEGPGAVGNVVPTAPPGYNGPPLSASDRRAVDDVPTDRRLNSDQITGQINWSVLGHRISYVGGYTHFDTPSNSATDTANFLPGRTSPQTLRTRDSFLTQELRISSDGPGHLLDYTVGYYYSRDSGTTRGQQIATYLPGAFGAPGAVPDPRTLNDKFSLPVLINFDGVGVENAFFGNATLHLGARTELTGGGRYIISKLDAVSNITLGSGFISTPIGFPCALAGFASTYDNGACDIPIAANPVPITYTAVHDTLHPFVYSASLSHRFSDDLLAYGTVASSWRRGGNNTYANAGNDPTLEKYLFLPPEKSTSYEVGLKTTFFDRRVRFNVAGFYQKFDGLLFQLGNIPYLSNNGASATVGTIVLNSTARAVVKGFDIDTAFQATPNWTISAAFSYADGHVDNDTTPCRDSNFDGIADAGTPTVAGFQQAGTALALCKSNRAVSRDPVWNATAQSELKQSIGQIEGYVRGLLTYYARNPRRDDGATIPAYGLLNVFGGIRSPDGAWDVGLFARNVTNTGIRTSRATDFINVAGDLATTFGVSGYRLVSYTPPREVGVQVRYSFGSR